MTKKILIRKKIQNLNLSLIASWIIIFLFFNIFIYKKSFNEAEIKLETSTKIAADYLNNFLIEIENIFHISGQSIQDLEIPTNDKITNILLRNLKQVKNGNEVLSHDIEVCFIDKNNNLVFENDLKIIEKKKLAKPILRSWSGNAKITPGKLVTTNPNNFIKSDKNIMPFSYGFEDRNRNFLGSLLIKASESRIIEKIQNLSPVEYIDFAILGKEKTIIFSSSDFGKNAPTTYKIYKNQGQFKLKNETYFYHQNNDLFSILTKINKPKLHQEFFIKTLFTNLILLSIIISFLIYNKNIKRLLIAPIEIFSYKKISPNEISKISKNIKNISELEKLLDLKKKISELENIDYNVFAKNFLSKKIASQKDFFKKSQFFSSSAHEIKNRIFKISGLCEIAKMLIDKKISDKNTKLNLEELKNIKSILEESIIDGNNLAQIIDDVKEVNDAAYFKNVIIENNQISDIKEIFYRSSKLMQARAKLKSKRIIVNFLNKENEEFLLEETNNKLIKQIIVSLLTKIINLNNGSKKISIKIEKIPEAAKPAIQDSLINNLNTKSEIQDDQLKTDVRKLIAKYRAKYVICFSSDGPGFSETKLKEKFKNFKQIKNDEMAIIDFSNLSIAMIKYFVEIEGGMLLIPESGKISNELRIII